MQLLLEKHCFITNLFLRLTLSNVLLAYTYLKTVIGWTSTDRSKMYLIIQNHPQ